MKRSLVIFLILILALVAGFIYFTKDEVTFTKETSVYKAVPVTSPVFVEIASLKSIPLNNPIIKELAGAGIGIPFFKLMACMDSLIQNSSEIQNSIRNEPFILAFSFAGRTDLIPLFIKNANTNSKKNNVRKLIGLLYPEGRYTYEERNYSSNKIIAISEAGNTILHFCFSGGLFIAGTNAIVVEQAVRQMSSYTILNDKFFTQVNKTATAQSGISVYINHTSFPELVGNLLNGETIQSIDEFGETVKSNYKKRAESFADFASWTELDVDLDDEKISLNGISVANDSLNHFLSVFDGQGSENFKADKLLPKNTSFFASFSISDKDRFFARLEEYFSHTDFYYKREGRIKKIESGLGTGLKNKLKQLVDGELIVATTVIPVEPSKETTFFIFHTVGKTAAEEQLNKWLLNYAEKKGEVPGSSKKVYAVDNETKFMIYDFPYPSFPGIWLGKPFAMAKARFVAFNGNSMIFCNSEKGLQEYLHNMVLGTTLDKDIRYLRFKQNTLNQANINIYVDINRAFSLNRQLFDHGISKQVEHKEETLRKIQAANWQVTHDKGLFFNSVMLAFNPNAQEEAQTTWQSNIGSAIRFKPQIVVNHDNPANREVILQDRQNDLHQVTNEGRVRWTVPLDGPVLGKIFQVDYYKNGKLQYLFNTKNKLYLIDRNGENVAHFPIQFGSPATAGVNVFDYDNNCNYRYFIPHDNKKVVAYDYSGKVVSGWIFKQADHVVTTPVQHLRVGKKDYIVFKDKSRIYILDRRGNRRVDVPVTFENSKNPLVLNFDGMPKIVATDVTGKVYYIFLNGKYAEKKTGRFSEGHFFTCGDLDGNEIPDFVFVDGNELKVMDEKGKKLYSKKFDRVVNDPPDIYTFGAGRKEVGIVDATSNRIYLFTPAGKLHNGFPLQGGSRFSIGEMTGNPGSLSLLVGSEGGNLLNYTLD